ncbi:MAG: hypothetical protein N2C14_05655, partial [Planctomycetales bacterium]
MIDLEHRFYARMDADPSDMLAKEIFTEWLEHQGDARAGFIRGVFAEASLPKLAQAAGIECDLSHWESLRRTSLEPTSWRLFAADCAARVLPLFESVFPEDDRPRQAIAAAWSGEAGIHEAAQATEAALAAGESRGPTSEDLGDFGAAQSAARA